MDFIAIIDVSAFLVGVCLFLYGRIIANGPMATPGKSTKVERFYRYGLNLIFAPFLLGLLWIGSSKSLIALSGLFILGCVFFSISIRLGYFVRNKYRNSSLLAKMLMEYFIGLSACLIAISSAAYISRFTFVAKGDAAIASMMVFCGVLISVGVLYYIIFEKWIQW